MFNKQLKANIKALDVQIGKLTEELTGSDETEYEIKLQRIEELTKVRSQLTESKVKDSSKEVIISGVFGIASVLMVLKYEQTEVITSKAFSMATKLIKGG